MTTKQLDTLRRKASQGESISREEAADLLDLPDELVTDLQSLVLAMKTAKPEAFAAAQLLFSLRPDYVHMVRVFAQSLHDAQTAVIPQPEEEEAAV